VDSSAGSKSGAEANCASEHEGMENCWERAEPQSGRGRLPSGTTKWVSLKRGRRQRDAESKIRPGAPWKTMKNQVNVSVGEKRPGKRGREHEIPLNVRHFLTELVEKRGRAG